MYPVADSRKCQVRRLWLSVMIFGLTIGFRTWCRKERIILAANNRAIDTVKSMAEGQDTSPSPITVDIYIAQHCTNCAYAYEIFDEIRQHFPQVRVHLIDIETTTEPIPEAVFATPTYLLNGRVWSLGNPSPAQVHETLSRFLA